MNSQMHRAAWLAVGMLWALLSGAPAVADDSELFIGTSTAAGAQPNILLIIDNSISMRDDVRTQATFDPSITYDPGTTGCRADRVYYVFGNAAQPDCSTTRWFDRAALKCSFALQAFNRVNGGFYTDYVAQYDDGSDKRWEALSTSSSRRDNAVECQDDAGIHGDGINTSNLYARNGATSNGYWGTATSSGRIANNAWGASPMDTQTVTMYSGNYMSYTYGPTLLRPKIDVAKDVASSLLDSVNGVNIGLMTFNPFLDFTNGSQGGYMVHKIDDIDAARTALQTSVNALTADAATPLSETLYEGALYMTGGTWDYGNSRSVANSRLTSPTSQYDSPIEYACQKNFVVLVTDGEPTWDADADSKIRGMADVNGATFGSLVGNTCDAETYPANLNPSGGQCLDDLAEFLYEGDFSTQPGQQNITTYTVGFDIDLQALADTAHRGGGDYYTAADTTQLANSLQQIVTSILAANTTFTAPTVAVNAFNRTQNLSDLFISVFRPTSRMHWPGNLKRFRLDATTLEILDANDRPAIDPATGFFTETAQDLWSSAPDGPDVEHGGAANRLPVPTSRVVYTNVGTAAASLSNLTHTDNRVATTNSLIEPFLNIQAGGPTTDEVIDFINGKDLPDVDQDNISNEPRNQLGDPLHSQPVSMVYGPGLRQGLIFSATNDGVLHAFDLDTGREQWAFIPKDFLDDQTELFDNDATALKHYGIDGDLAIQIVADSDSEIEPGEKVYLFFGMRRGGDFYYGLDVSDPTAPQLLWRIDSSTLTGIGQSWSTPVPTKINVNGVDKLALVIGGGYETDQDIPLPVPFTDTVGNSIYIVDSVTGALIWRGSKTGATANFPKMDYSIPSDVRVIDLDGNGFADRMYVGDMGGQVWRFDINNGQPAASLVAGGVIAQLGAAPSATPTVANARRFYYAPDVAPVNSRGYDFIHIGIGSGSRGNPLGTQTQDRFYALRDFNFGRMDQTAFDALTPIDNSMLELINTVNESIPQNGTKKGWYINLGTGNGEKVLAESRTFNNEVIFTTFRPGSTGTGCVPQLGTNRVYRMSVYNASPVLNLDGSADPTTLTMSDLYIENEGSPLPAPQMIFLPPDRDGDGIPDTEDDTDGDGIPDVDDPDYDGDGVDDTLQDTDGDGTPDNEDDDIDNDGTPNSTDPDADGDGRNDLQYQDLNMNGVPDFLETHRSGAIVTVIGLMRFPEGYRNDPVRTYWRQSNIGN